MLHSVIFKVSFHGGKKQKNDDMQSKEDSRQLDSNKPQTKLTQDLSMFKAVYLWFSFIVPDLNVGSLEKSESCK